MIFTDLTTYSEWTKTDAEYEMTTSGSCDIDWDAVNEEKERIAEAIRHAKQMSEWNRQFRYKKPVANIKLKLRKEFAMRRM